MYICKRNAVSIKTRLLLQIYADSGNNIESTITHEYRFQKILQNLTIYNIFYGRKVNIVNNFK